MEFFTNGISNENLAYMVSVKINATKVKEEKSARRFTVILLVDTTSFRISQRFLLKPLNLHCETEIRQAKHFFYLEMKFKTLRRTQISSRKTTLCHFIFRFPLWPEVDTLRTAFWQSVFKVTNISAMIMTTAVKSGAETRLKLLKSFWWTFLTPT